jgi:hypothetical protein
VDPNAVTPQPLNEVEMTTLDGGFVPIAVVMRWAVWCA